MGFECRRIVFNHFYVLKHDLKRTYFFSKKGNEKLVKVGIDKEWATKIHPIYAMMFSLASHPIELNDFIEAVADFMDIDYKKAEAIVLPFLDREEPFYSEYGGVVSQFPRNVLIDAEDTAIPPCSYRPEDFSFQEIDLEQQRSIVSPRTAVFMPNNTCTTDCVYCYADRSSGHKQMAFEQVNAIIRQCKDLNMANFSLTGGDIFRYPYWKDLVKAIIENGFSLDLLSTKTPLSLEDVEFLKKHNVYLQFSLDTVDPGNMKKILGMNEVYWEKVKQTFGYFEKVGLSVKVATVLTVYNATVQQLADLASFFNQFHIISLWEIRVAMKSLYSKANFDELKISKKTLEEVDDKIHALEKEVAFRISWTKQDIRHYFEGKEGSKSFGGSRCSANYSNIMILPDGQVTICEQLYWNPKFIIGDLTKQTVQEVWNSPRALELAFPKREYFRDASPCKKCKLFDDCYAYPNRCIVDVLKGYGVENEDFPDPRCAMAPPFVTELRPV